MQVKPSYFALYINGSGHSSRQCCCYSMLVSPVMAAFRSFAVVWLMNVIALFFTIAPYLGTISNTSTPTAVVKNGTLRGRYLESSRDQDLFLGIPFAKPLVGPLRFRWPQELNESFSSPRDVSAYGHSCYQYVTNFNLSEDCPTLNGIFLPPSYFHQI